MSAERRDRLRRHLAAKGVEGQFATQCNTVQGVEKKLTPKQEKALIALPRYRGAEARMFYAARGGIEPGNWRRDEQ
jgi:hypothetical protein